jgi:hypothetical protein|nr:MobQ family relaxase [Moraxella sp. CTOTU47724]
MAIYHLSTKPISRSSGRSAVASIAYRAGIAITDERLGKTYDYTKRHGVLWTGLATPNDVKVDRNELWNLAEKSENRSNSRTAREIVINIPHELMQGDQGTGNMLAHEFASQLSKKYQVAVDVAVHAPDKQGDNRNFHAHLLLTTRKIELDRNGNIKLTDKSQLEMSNTQLKQAGLLSNQDELKEIRKAWADLTNEYLAEHGIDERIDHRSHKDRGLDTLPTVKMGWQATELERNGIRTDVGNKNRDIKAHNANLMQKKILESEIVIQQTLKNASKTPIEPHKDISARVTSPTPIKSQKSEIRPPSVDVRIDVSQHPQKPPTDEQDWRSQYEVWKAQKNAPVSEQTIQPPNALQTLEQSAMSKYEQWKAEKALAEQQVQREAERQRQLAQRQIKPTPKYDNDIGFSP